MNQATFRLVLLISCAHAMVHTFEHTLPAVEQLIGEEYGVGADRTGALGTIWRLPFGLGALAAGWLADRFGSRRMLLVYLSGCGATAGLCWFAPSLLWIFVVMFAMGCFASIYHPAGLALISSSTSDSSRGAALGWHGILGSIGIAAAPFLAALVFAISDISWRGLYVLLTLPAAVIAVMIIKYVPPELGITPRAAARPAEELAAAETADGSHHHRRDASEGEGGELRAGAVPSAANAARNSIPWAPFLVLVAGGALLGLVYAAFLHFLPRYLNETGLRPEGWSEASFRNLLATAALMSAAVGQGVAGRFARPDRLELQLVCVFAANIPFLVGMAFAEGASRFAVVCLLAFVHFMNQPIYNSLVAKMIPASRRSVGFGFSNMMCFGIGSFGPLLAGLLPTARIVYISLASVAAVATLMATLLWRMKTRATSQVRTSSDLD